MYFHSQDNMKYHCKELPISFLCFNAAMVMTQFLNDKITREFSEQNTYLLPYRKVQYFR